MIGNRAGAMVMALVLVVGLLEPLCQAAGEGADESQLTIQRIYVDGEFQAEELDAQWLADGQGYTTLEAAKDLDDGQDIVRHDAQVAVERRSWFPRCS